MGMHFTKAAMRNAMMKILDELEDDIRKNLILTFRKRCEDCIINKGGLVHFLKRGQIVATRNNRYSNAPAPIF
jgi:hypothetical protein